MLEPLTPFSPEQTIEQTAAQFRAELDALHETQYGLAKRLNELGDRRPFSTILRSIQRVAAGETKISGEMQVVITLLKRDRDDAKEEASLLDWVSGPNNVLTAETKGFSIFLEKERAGWRITVRYLKTGYDHPWPKFPETVEEAKIKALLCLEDARHAVRADAAMNAFQTPA